MKSRISLPVLMLVLCSFVGALVAGINIYITVANVARIFRDPLSLPYRRVALILGTSDQTRNGGSSPFFRSRIEGAVRLYREHKCSHFLASGDNAHVSYNEPLKIRQALVAQGIPPDRIIMDYAGFSTLDSIIRAKEVFGLDECIVVTQRFQAERAAFIAQTAGLDVLAYAVQDAGGMLDFNMQVREVFARVKAFMDVYVLNTRPRYLGKPETIE